VALSKVCGERKRFTNILFLKDHADGHAHARMQGLPPMISGFMVMRRNSCAPRFSAWKK
jgi:hypothetical protein